MTASTANGRKGPEVRIAVTDKGLGISSADLPHIFERYRRASNVIDRFSGTGLGLAGAKEIVDAIDEADFPALFRVMLGEELRAGSPQRELALSRQAGAAGLASESRMLFELARRNRRHERVRVNLTVWMMERHALRHDCLHERAGEQPAEKEDIRPRRDPGVLARVDHRDRRGQRRDEHARVERVAIREKRPSLVDYWNRPTRTASCARTT